MTDSDIIDQLLVAEGWPKYTNDPDDRGGPTKGGITQATLAAWRGRSVSPQDVEALTRDEAAAIYRRRYIEDPRFNKIINDELRAQVIDAGVLHGTGTATQWLQALAGVKIDGNLGPITAQAVNALSPRKAGVLFGVMRVCFIGHIIANNYEARKAGKTDKDQSRFAKGWLIRATNFIKDLA